MNEMTVKTCELTIIGQILTPHHSLQNMPIQSVGAKGVMGVIELFPEYVEGLTHLDGFSDLVLLYHFHKTKGYSLMLTPFMDDKEHGVFATRSPKRPSHIGMSTVQLIRIDGNKIYFEGADMLNGTPLIDIKPFFRQTDNRIDAKCGWLDSKADGLVINTRSDKRFLT